MNAVRVTHAVRRRILGTGLLGALSSVAGAGFTPALHAQDRRDSGVPRFTPAQERAFRAWMVRLIEDQFVRGPNPRWHHRDCAGLVRFAVMEALSVHDARWLQANRLAMPLPPELNLTPAQSRLRNTWVVGDQAARAPYVSAFGLISRNTQFIAKQVNLCAPGDLLFFDQGDDQHLMVWLGSHIAYHTGSATPDDNGLRLLTLAELARWRDTRWRIDAHNPNYIGAFRLNFLTRGAV